MDFWTSFWSGLSGFVAEYGLLSVAIILLLKSAGIPLPVPGDLLVVFVGVQARTEDVPLLGAWVLLSGARSWVRASCTPSHGGLAPKT
jgi:hypothetical protein